MLTCHTDTAVTIIDALLPGVIVSPARQCAQAEFNVMVKPDSATTPLNTLVALFEIVGNGAAKVAGTQTYTGNPLNWKRTGTTASVNKYVAVCIPPAGFVCNNSILTDTAVTIIDALPLSIVISQKGSILHIDQPNPVFSHQWQWQQANGEWTNIAGATGDTYIVHKTGHYRVQNTNSFCTQISNVIQVSGKLNIDLFPNPSQEIITISPLPDEDGWKTLTIVNSRGEQARSVLNIDNQNQVSIDIRALPAGIYIVVLKGKSGQKGYLKFVKL
jgi:hypothetical protein